MSSVSRVWNLVVFGYGALLSVLLLLVLVYYASAGNHGSSVYAIVLLCMMVVGIALGVISMLKEKRSSRG